MLPGNINLPLALSAGLVAAFNPCGIVLLPSYITYLFSHNENNGKENKVTISLLMYGLKVGLSMTLGFSLIFLAAGLLISVLGHLARNIIPQISALMGIILLIIGLWLIIKPEKFPGLNFTTNLGDNIKQKNKLNSFLYGIGYGLVSLGCTLPVFMMIVFTSFSLGNIQEGMLNFILYIAGMGIAITLISILSLTVRKKVEKAIKKIMPYMNQIMGVLLVLAGGYLIYYYWF